VAFFLCLALENWTELCGCLIFLEKLHECKSIGGSEGEGIVLDERSSQGEGSTEAYNIFEGNHMDYIIIGKS
jgi:hypothetical protein